ncbi:hypothetical protein KAR91_84450 [Candidatus Pacearchaeota archaeon]|nr:hypothetical protein [Candidatus Pacearchaeota archaeon]
MCKLNDPLKVVIDDQDREAITYALVWINSKLKELKRKDLPETLQKASQGLQRLEEKINNAAQALDEARNEWLALTKELLEKKKK